jgi:excisionase family DNA binding protein
MEDGGRMDAEYLTVPEVAGVLRVEQESVRRWLRMEQLPGVRLGRAGWRIRKDDVERFIAERYTGKPSTSEGS